jgi:hypothetical protein
MDRRYDQSRFLCSTCLVPEKITTPLMNGARSNPRGVRSMATAKGTPTPETLEIFLIWDFGIKNSERASPPASMPPEPAHESSLLPKREDRR